MTLSKADRSLYRLMGIEFSDFNIHPNIGLNNTVENCPNGIYFDQSDNFSIVSDYSEDNLYRFGFFILDFDPYDCSLYLCLSVTPKRLHIKLL